MYLEPLSSKMYQLGLVVVVYGRLENNVNPINQLSEQKTKQNPHNVYMLQCELYG